MSQTHWEWLISLITFVLLTLLIARWMRER
jgi:hypothetical protein